jgi:hypothetical protein
VIEKFLGVNCAVDTTSSSLKQALDGMFARYGLSVSRLCGQGYDGASNMRGEFHGLRFMCILSFTFLAVVVVGTLCRPRCRCHYHLPPPHYGGPPWHRRPRTARAATA